VTWNKEAVGKTVQDARLLQGLTYEDVSLASGVQSSVVSSLERGRHVTPPRRGTQAKIEAALGIVLPIPRGPSRRVILYIPLARESLVDEAMTRFSGQTRSAAIFSALEEWSAHRKVVDKWNEAHPDGKV